MRRTLLISCAAAWLAAVATGALPRGLEAQPVLVSPDAGHAALGLALRKLGVTGTFLQITAHPDDESNGLLAMLGRGQGLRVVLMTATRGNGGQNEIGPELFEDLAVVRTAELLAAHRLDGAEQVFTRAVDFGYSFSTDETLRKWGKDEILGDFVRQIRTIRPDVIVAMRPDGEGGGQHHQTSAILAREAFRAAADPSRYPEQLAQGLRPWQSGTLYFSAGFGGRGGVTQAADPALTRINTAVYDSLLGRTYSAIGFDARSMHKCQGVGQLGPLAGQGAVTYRLADTALADRSAAKDTTLFDGIDTTVEGLARLAGASPQDGLVSGLADIGRSASAAREAFAAGHADQVAAHVLSGLAAVRALRASLPARVPDANHRADIDERLAGEEADFADAAVLAHGIHVGALVDDGLAAPGQSVNLTLLASNRGSHEVQLDDVKVTGLDGEITCPATTLRPGNTTTCTPTSTVPIGAALTEALYWRTRADAARHDFDPAVPFGVPFRPSPFVATFALSVNGVPVMVRQPVQYRYEGSLFVGEKRMELTVVPAFSVRVSPGIVIVPAGRAMVRTGTAPAADAGHPVHVTVISAAKGAATARVTLRAPEGWRVTPAAAPLEFSHEDQSLTARFVVSPPPGVAPGTTHVLAATVTSDTVAGGPFEQGYQVVEYPHIERRHLYHPATAQAKVVDVTPPPALTVGYIMGVGDVVPAALEALGADVEYLDADELAWGDLGRYPVIVVGVRAYERRADLRTYNRRLLDYVQQGGTVVVQYNKMEFNDAQYGPYPAKVSSNRVTDENAAVEILVPDHPVFTTPNRIGAATWTGWVQERGLYFLGERDPKYVDLVQLEDSFPYNRGVKRGALVEARAGSGRWIYVGLGLFRQVQAGTPGAYQLLANLVALGQRPARGTAAAAP